MWWYADKLCNSGDKKILRKRQIRKSIEDKNWGFDSADGLYDVGDVWTWEYFDLIYLDLTWF